MTACLRCLVHAVRAIQRAPGVGDRRGVGPQIDGVGLRLHVVHRQRVEEPVGGFAGLGDAHGMRMVIDGANPLDFRGEIRIGGWRSVGATGECEGGERQRRKTSHDDLF